MTKKRNTTPAKAAEEKTDYTALAKALAKRFTPFTGEQEFEAIQRNAKQSALVCVNELLFYCDACKTEHFTNLKQAIEKL